MLIPEKLVMGPHTRRRAGGPGTGVMPYRNRSGGCRQPPRTPHQNPAGAPCRNTGHAPGAGYSADLAYALKRLDGPVLVVPPTCHCWTGNILESISYKHDADFWTTILVSEGYAARLGLSEGLDGMVGGRSVQVYGHLDGGCWPPRCSLKTRYDKRLPAGRQHEYNT